MLRRILTLTWCGRFLWGGVASASIALTACAAPEPPPPLGPPVAPQSPAVATAPPPAAAATLAPVPELTSTVSPAPPLHYTVEEFSVPRGSGPHDVAPARDGGVWFTAQQAGKLGWLDPATGSSTLIDLGRGAAPHGVVVGPDGAAWVTDGGLNAIVRVDGGTREVRVFRLPAGRGNANLNTAAFDTAGVLWFTGQNGVYGRFDPKTEAMQVFDAPRGAGPYGITATPDGSVYYASLAGNYVGRIDTATNQVTVLEPPAARQGARRVWADGEGNVWVSEWTAGQVGVYRPATGQWQEWKLPGARPQAYAVFVDEQGGVWLSDWGSNAVVRFDPASGQFTTVALPTPNSNVRQILGRPGEVWLPLSGADKLAVIRTR